MSDPSNLEHLDEVVSAYVDGEATPEEVRLVEADPALMEQVEMMRGLVALDEAVPTPDPEMKRRHLAAAMAAFEDIENAPSAPTVDLTAATQIAPTGATPTATAPPETAPVIDLTSRRRGPAGLPRILTAAAGVLVVLGGIGFVASQSRSSDETATADAGAADDTEGEVFQSRPSDDEASPATTEAAALAGDGGDADTEAMAEESEESFAQDDSGDAVEADDDAMEDDAMEDEAAEESMADDSGTTDAEGETVASPQDQESFLEVLPDTTVDELLAITDGLAGFALDEAACGPTFTQLAPETNTARKNFDTGTAEWFPAIIDDTVFGEFVVATDAAGERAGALFNENCELIER